MKLKEIVFKKNVIITSAIIFFLLFIEFTLDSGEIVVGKFLDLTNGLRPQAGTIWELTKKDEIAADSLSELSPPLTDNTILQEIDTPLMLTSILNEQETVIISAEQFLKIYNQLPPATAGEIIFPFDLLKISLEKKWEWTKIARGSNRLSFFFLDGDYQLLLDSYPDLSILYHVKLDFASVQHTLSSMPVFVGRTFTADQFFKAFNNLPNPIKLQLINNPYDLVRWYQKIKLVGIANAIEEQTVAIGFEVIEENVTRVYTFQASTIAANYFIDQLNTLYPDLDLTMPGY